MTFADKKILLIGLGRTTMAAARLLLREGGRPAISEFASGHQFDAMTTQLDELGIPYELGGHSAEFRAGADIVMPSPGVNPQVPVIQERLAEGAILENELDLAFDRCRSKVIAVTGTNGKTTTTELLTAMIEACGHSVSLGGNNATPFSEVILQEAQPDYVVLELSSYQLETAERFRPDIGVVLNVTDDHLERHGDIENYAKVKARLFAQQRPNDYAILNDDDARVRDMCRSYPQVQVRYFSQKNELKDGVWTNDGAIYIEETEVARTSDVPLPGAHNLENCLAALSVMHVGKFDIESSLTALREFSGVEHRIEPVATIKGITFYNDSKSTNIESLAVALKAFDEPVVLIAGGQAKAGDYSVLRELVAQKVSTLITIGHDGATIASALAGDVPTRPAKTMADAVELGFESASENVLLSPGCASFDEYDNFEHRGQVFKKCVAALREKLEGEVVART